MRCVASLSNACFVSRSLGVKQSPGSEIVGSKRHREEAMSHDSLRDREREFERERQRQRREAEAAAQAEDRVYREKLREWEREEK